MESTCFVTFIFKANLAYFPSFLISLERQEDCSFTLMVFNDAVDDLDDYFKQVALNVKVVDVTGTPNQIRTKAFEYLKGTDFDFFIFGDSDDTFELNRVFQVKKLLKEYDIVANDVNLMSESGNCYKRNYWKNRKELNDKIDLSSIEKFNFLGLGNTAIQKHSIPNNLEFPEEVIALDWLLFSRILAEGKSAIFTTATATNYRQHDGNTVGRRTMSVVEVRRVVEVKYAHFNNMAFLLPRMKEKVIQYRSFLNEIDRYSKEEIVNRILKIESPFWWEEIQL